MITLESERKAEIYLCYNYSLNLLRYFSRFMQKTSFFFNYRTTSHLTNTIDHHRPYPYAYPPRFVLEVSAQDATGPSTFKLTFNRAKRDLSIEIQLHSRISNRESANS